MSKVKERVSKKLKTLKKNRLNPLELKYPLTIKPYGTFHTPKELVKWILTLSDEEVEKVSLLLRTAEIFGVQKAEETLYSHKPITGDIDKFPKLKKLYDEFREELSEASKELPPKIKDQIRKDMPVLSPYVITEDSINVIVEYKGETIYYTLYTGDRNMLKIKAICLISDLRDITTGDYIPF